MRYVGSVEACWHIYGFEIHDRFPLVTALRVHLPEEHQIVFDEDTELEALENQRDTELTAFFDFNKASIDQGFEPQELPRYSEMPEGHRYEKKQKKWIIRKQKVGNVIGRVHSIHPVAEEVYFERLLLHDNHCRGKVSFEDLRTLHNGRVCETFKEVCSELGLLSNDTEWHRILDESAVTKMCPEIRQMFVIILIFCLPTNPLTLFNEFWTTWFDNFQHKARRRGVQLENDQLKTLVLLDLEMRLSSFDRVLQDYGLPTPSVEEMHQVENVTSNQPAVVREELEFDFEELRRTAAECIGTFTPEHLAVFEAVMDAVKNDKSLCIFLTKSGGNGFSLLAQCNSCFCQDPATRRLCSSCNGNLRHRCKFAEAW